MVSNRSVLALCAAAAALVLPGVASAAAPSSLVGEDLVGSGSVTRSCTGINATADVTVSGTALAPYPGSFTETASTALAGGAVTALHAEFTIDSPSTATTITGTKDLILGGGECVFPGPFSQFEADSRVTYQAILHGTQGSFADSGTGFFSVRADFGAPDSGAATVPISFFDETFDTSNGVVPADKTACKNGGYRDFPQFKNQGACVSFVATGGQNP